MKHYKDSSDNLFGLDDNIAPPSGYIEITIEDARAIAAAKAPLPAPVVLTPAEKLAQSGLTVDELKVLLGL